MSNNDTSLKNRPAPESSKKINEINAALRERFGDVDGTGRQRFIATWGQSPASMMFACDLWHMKYLGAVHHVEEIDGFFVYKINDPSRPNYISAKNARGTIQKQNGEWIKDDKSIIVPKKRTETIEVGLPLWVVERLATPQELVGFDVHPNKLKEVWEKERWLEPNDPMNPTGQLVDVLGKFPENGDYVGFIYLQHEIIRNGKIAEIEYMNLDNVDSILGMVAEEWDKFMKWQETPSNQRVKIKEEAITKREEKRISDSFDEVADEIKRRLLGIKQIGYSSQSYAGKAQTLEPLSTRARNSVLETFNLNKLVQSSTEIENVNTSA